MLNLSAMREKGFSLVPMPEAAMPTVKFSGNGDGEAIAPLDRFLKLLHKNLVDTSSTEVYVDLCDLYFMNSSCLKAFVSWIYKVNTTGRPYQIHLQMNPRQPWQRRSLEPLKRLAPAVVFLDDLTVNKPEAATPAGR